MALMAANKCSAAAASVMPAPAARDQAGQSMSLSCAVAQLNCFSAGVSVEPADYNWGTPTLLQQQALYSQFLQLAFMCSLPQLQYAHLSGMQPGRSPMFPGFMPPFTGITGFMPPVAAPCSTESPAPAPCPNAAAPQASGPESGKQCFEEPEMPTGKAVKTASPTKKSGSGSKAKAAKAASVATSAAVVAATCVPKDDPEMELEDICRLLGDDAFLEHLQDDVLSEGSNGSSSTSEGRVVSKNNSNGCLSGSVNNNDGGFFAGNSFASAFDMDVDGMPPAAVNFPDGKAPSAAQAPLKASSGDLNNMAASSPSRSTRSSRSAAREAAAAAKEAGAKEGVVTKITLKPNKGGVHKVSGSKPLRGHASAHITAAAAAATASPASVHPSGEEYPLTAADLSRLLGEDDNRIPDGWDLDLDFENPFSCSISAI